MHGLIAMSLSIGLAAALSPPALASTASPVSLTQAASQPDTPAILEARQRLAEASVGERGDTSNRAINARYGLGMALETAGRFAEAEVEYQRVLTLLSPRLAPTDPNWVNLARRLANVQMGQEKFEAVLATARPIYEQSLALNGPEDEVTRELRMALAAALARLGRYAESEPFVRASFDDLRARGDDQGAADIAATLAMIYRQLDRPEDARAVLRLVEGDDPVRRLINDAERAETPTQQAAAWRRVVEALPPDSPERYDPELQLAFALAMSASGANTGPAREAATLARDLIDRGRRNGRDEVVRQAEQILGTAMVHLDQEDGMAGATTVRMAQSALDQALIAHAPDSRTVVTARLYLAMAAASDRQFDRASRELDQVEAWMMAHPAGLDMESQAHAAIARAFIQGERDDLAGAYSAIHQATAATEAVAMAQADGSRRAHLDSWSKLFRIQVRWAWGYAEHMDAGTQSP